ncbi:hypothetical protein J2741_000321 [Methanolinea mesophila]|uniref:hypothetical protein n=1 Tax=Methanolinea mesophila TaxID=547055 RepID=UPI001AE7A9D8|nr:hypothetical protein [Methanolinea mesophila]MBP1927774.1 hypothetical protein [Methanolinea mesophila]
MSSLSDTIASFGTSERILAILFGLGFVIGFLLTPLGFETRMNEIRTLAFGVFFIVVGLLLPLAGLAMLLVRRSKLAGVLAIIDAAFLFLVAPADQAKFFFTVPPPPAVTAGEFILIFVGIGYMLYGQRVYLGNGTSREAPRSP